MSEERALAALTGVPHRVVRHGPVSSLEEAAAARGLPVSAVVKSLVLRRGEDDYLFVLVPGGRKLSWPKLRALLGVSRLSLPDAAAALARPGYRRGTITPFGSPTTWPAVAYASLRTVAVLAGARCGRWRLELMEDGGQGCIINPDSVAGQDGQIGQAAAAASKAGVLGMALPIARDLMGEGIRVNTILPGIFETPMMAMMPQNVRDALAQQVPFPKRLGTAAEYARLAVFMAETVYLNGEYVRLDGAIRMAPR